MARDEANIRSIEHLVELLNEFGWFEDGHCVMLWPPPTEVTPDRVELVLRDAGTGGYRPGDVRTYQALRLTATEIEEWSFEGDEFFHSPQHCTEGAEPVELGTSFGVTLDVPSPVRLLAHSYEFERLPEVAETVEAWTSDRDVHIDAASGHLPTASDWINALAREGLVVAWRLYGDPPAELSRVPEENYGGWFLQQPERTSVGNGGVMLRAFDDGTTLAIVMDRWEADDELWYAVRRAAGLMFREGTFRSGNSSLSSEEWIAHVSDERD
jgi:hypothetical protein